MSDEILTDRFDQAFVYASRLHASQRRKGAPTPYISHLMAVAGLVLEDGGDEDEAIAALLHDAVEDQGGQPTLEEIRARFGDRVARIVEECSDTDITPKPPWLERKQQYLQHLQQAPPEVLRVSLADKIHNARCVVADCYAFGPVVWQRFNANKNYTLWYYLELLDVFRQRYPGPQVEKFARVVQEMAEAVQKP